MTIAEVSKKLELSADTLRYYERIGLIPPVPRNKSGIRDYDENSIGWINFIKCMRKAGLPIEVLIEYVTLYQLGDSTKEARKNLLIEQREELISKIEELKETLEYLNKKIEFCKGCLSCQNTGKCIIKDDANEIIEKIKNSDVVVFSTPIYFYEMAGQMKTLLDRTNPL